MNNVLYVEGCADKTVGGSHTCLFSLVANLDKERFRPVVVFYDDHGVAEKLRSLGVETHIFRERRPFDFRKRLEGAFRPLAWIAVAALPLQKALNFASAFVWPAVRCARLLKSSGIDLVHLNNSINTNHEWIVAAKLAGARLVSHERGISTRMARTAKALAKAVDLMICVSEATRRSLLDQGLDGKKMIVVYDGIDPARLQTRRSLEQVRSAYGLTERDPVIGVVGNIKRWKGQETVVRAVGLLKGRWPGLKCLLVGATLIQDAYRDELERLIDGLGIRGSVVFTGFQDNPLDLVQAMDVVVHSSIEPEPFGMVNLEAMFLGKPVIATAMGGPTEIFVNGEDGFLVEPGDPQALARSVALLLENPGLRERVGRKARESVLGRFRIADTVRQVEKAYADLLGAAARPAPRRDPPHDVGRA